MSFPIPWVDKIFRKLTLLYGNDFTRRYEGIPTADVKTDWCSELEGFEKHPEAIVYALEHMDPGKPPTAREFKALCRRAPAPEAPRLPAPKPDPKRLAEELKKLAPLRKDLAARPARNPRQWAHDILAAHEAGRYYTRTVLAMAREAAAE